MTMNLDRGVRGHLFRGTQFVRVSAQKNLGSGWINDIKLSNKTGKL